MDPAESTPAPPGIRFSLRGLLLFVSALALVAALVAREMRISEQQFLEQRRQTISELQRDLELHGHLYDPSDVDDRKRVIAYLEAELRGE